MPPSQFTSAELPGLFERQFTRCAVKAGETVVLLTDHNTSRDVVQAAFVAATTLGAESFELGLPRALDLQRVGHDKPGAASGLLAALKSADLLCTFFPPNLSPWLAECRQGGTRVLSVTDKPEQLKRLEAPGGTKEAVLHAARRYAAARTLRLTNEAGTDLTWRRGDPKWSELRAYYGYADVPGHFDQWGMAMVADFPDEGTANGVVVIKPGDLWILPFVRAVESEIRLEVREGYIRSIRGGLDAKAFKDWLDRNRRSPEDMDPYAVSHLGFGLHPNAFWDDVLTYGNSVTDLTMAARAYAGNFLFSTGPGPHRRTKGHIDMPMNDCTLYFDGEAFLEGGRVADPAAVIDGSRTS
jgi:2,5-dihydroxypyridine 5,6-dioxygenase